MKPTASKKKFPEIEEMPTPPGIIQLQLAGKMEPYIKVYRMGKLSIIVGLSPQDGFHVSISHPSRYPSWDEIVHIRYSLLPNGLTMALLLPPIAEYINLHPNCFQLNQIGE